MGTTAQKLEYLGTTKSQLKDMINYGLDENKITSSTTFRNYVSSIKEAFLEALRTPDTLFTNLPKKSGTGSNITLNDTANASMRIELGASELTQDGTPTPSSPQDIHTISGDNTIKVIGTNLFDNSKVEIGKAWHGGSNSKRARFYIEMTPGTDYAIRVDSFTNLNEIAIVESASNWSTSKYTSVQTSAFTMTHTFSTGATYLCIQFQSADNFTQDMANAIQLMLNYGDTAKAYTPYISQEAEIDLNGANLISDIPYKVNYYIDASGNEQYSNGTAIYKFNCQSNTQYTFSLYNGTSSGNLRIHAYNGNTWLSQIDVISTTAGNDYTKTFTTPNNANNVRISFYNYTRNIMVNKGNIALPYSKYSPINYSKISTYEDKFIRTSGKNLLPVINQSYSLNSVSFKAENGSIRINGTASANITGFMVRTDDYFPITLEAGTYYFKRNLTNLSVGLIKADSNDATVSLSSNSSATSTTFTLVEKTKLYLFFYIASGTTISNQDWQIMVSKTNDDYEPYGNGTWYIKKNIGKVVLDGSENLWSMYGETGKRKWYLQKSYFGNQVPFVNWSDKSNRFGYSGYISGAWTNNKFGWHTSANSMVFDTDFGESLSDWTTWLASNNVIIYYAYSTPTYTQITGTLETQLENVYQKLLSQTGTTNISQVNNDLPFIMNVQAIEV